MEKKSTEKIVRPSDFVDGKLKRADEKELCSTHNLVVKQQKAVVKEQKKKDNK